MLQGVIFCHGHKHKPYLDTLPYYIPAGVNWTLVDIQEDAEPDIVADYSKVEQTIAKLGANRYDYVIDKGCPIFGIKELFTVAYNLLKPSQAGSRGGKFIIFVGVKKIISVYGFKYEHYLNNVAETDTGDLIDVLTEIGAMPSFEQLQNLIPTTDFDFILFTPQMTQKYNHQDPILLDLLKYTLPKLTTFGNFKSWLIPYTSPNSSELSTDIIFTKA